MLWRLSMWAWAKRGLLAAALGGFGLGCVGEIGDKKPGDDGDASPSSSPTDLRRLTAEQYRNTVIDVFSSVPALDVGTVAAAALSFVPADGTQDGTEPYTRMDRRLSPPQRPERSGARSSKTSAIASTPWTTDRTWGPSSRAATQR